MRNPIPPFAQERLEFGMSRTEGGKKREEKKSKITHKVARAQAQGEVVGLWALSLCLSHTLPSSSPRIPPTKLPVYPVKFSVID